MNNLKIKLDEILISLRKSGIAAFGPQKRRLYDYMSDNTDNWIIDLLGC